MLHMSSWELRLFSVYIKCGSRVRLLHRRRDVLGDQQRGVVPGVLLVRFRDGHDAGVFCQPEYPVRAVRGREDVLDRWDDAVHELHELRGGELRVVGVYGRGEYWVHVVRGWHYVLDGGQFAVVLGLHGVPRWVGADPGLRGNQEHAVRGVRGGGELFEWGDDGVRGLLGVCGWDQGFLCVQYDGERGVLSVRERDELLQHDQRGCVYGVLSVPIGDAEDPGLHDDDGHRVHPVSGRELFRELVVVVLHGVPGVYGERDPGYPVHEDEGRGVRDGIVFQFVELVVEFV